MGAGHHFHYTPMPRRESLGVTDIKGLGPEEAAVERRFRPSRRRRTSTIIVVGLAASAGIAGSGAGCRPTGTRIVDPLYAALFAALITYACSRAGRKVLLLFSAVGVIMSRNWLELPAAAALLIAFISMFPRHSRRRVGALIGALSVESLLRWQPVAFHGSTAAVASAVLVPVAISAYRRVSTARRRHAKRLLALAGLLVAALSVPLVVAVAMAGADVSSGQHAAAAALSDVSNGNSSSAESRLQAATTAFGGAASKFGSWWMSVAAVVPGEAQQRHALVTGATAARELIAAAKVVAPKLDYHELSYHKGQVDLQSIRAMLEPAQEFDRFLDRTTARLATLSSPWLVWPIQSRLRTFDLDVGRARSSTDLAVRAIPLLPAMLGAQRPQHYFVAFVSPSESRGLDGIVGAYGELTAVNGHISLAVSGPVESLDSALPINGGRLTGLADFMDRYGQFDPQKYFQDVTYSPDFPTVADVISQLYPQTGGDELDGVLMLDPYGLARLLSITGPVKVPGFSQALTSRNAAGILLKGEYLADSVTNAATQNARHDLLQNALHITFQRVVNGSLPGPRALSRDLEPAVLNGRIAFWSAHPSDASLVRALHLEDAFPMASGGDLLAVTTQNAGANKIDAYLHTSIADYVNYDPRTGAERSSVQVTLTNDAPSTGLPPLVIASPADPSLAPGTNETWLSVYSPLSFDQVTVDGTPGTMSATRELGVWAYSTYVDVAPGASVTVRVGLRGRVATGSALRLSARLQPAANPVRAQVVVTPVGPWKLAGSRDSGNWGLGSSVGQERTFQFVAK